MLRQLGTPTWFLTLSAADIQWPEMIQSIGRQYGRIFSDEEVLAMSWEVLMAKNQPSHSSQTIPAPIRSLLQRFYWQQV